MLSNNYVFDISIKKRHIFWKSKKMITGYTDEIKLPWQGLNYITIGAHLWINFLPHFLDKNPIVER